MAIHYLSPSWDEYHESIQKLAATILDHSPDVDEIVAISRGGLTLGRLLSDFLRVPIFTIAIQSYTDIKKQGVVTITGKLQSSIRGKHILLVDDVSETGKTFHRAITYLKKDKPKKITTVAVYFKSHSDYRPDYFAHETTKWVLFPYEPTEMILLITQKMEKEQKTKKEIQRFLEKLGFPDNQIAFTWRHHLAKPI